MLMQMYHQSLKYMLFILKCRLLVFKRSLFMFLSFMMLICMNQASADFQVRSKYCPNEAYGDMETIPFYNAIEKHTKDPESGPVFVDFLENEVLRFYVRGSLSGVDYMLDKISNKSALPSIFTGGTIVRPKATKRSLGLELAVGVVWTPEFRTEVEYLVNRDFLYAAAPVLLYKPFADFRSEIINNVLLLNFYFDFSPGSDVRPYIYAGLGGSMNGAHTIGAPLIPGGGKKVKQQLSVAGTAGAGFRYRFLPFWYADFKYHYTYLGVAKMQTNTIDLQGTYGMNSVSIGIMYIF